jgi:hypothetical protein
MAGLFLIAIWLPLVLGAFSRSTQSETEFRTFAPFPDVAWSVKRMKAFPREFEAYFNDHFGLRDLLLALHNSVKIDLGVSPSPKVVLGKDQWLFYAGEGELDDHLGRIELTPKQLEQWRDYVVTVRDWLRARGVGYIFVVPPDKTSVYPEHLPTRYRNLEAYPTRLDQMETYLETHSDLNILDLRPVLMAAKGGLPLYHRTGTHWNDYGGYVGYQALMAATPWRTQMLRVPENAFILQPLTPGSDLARMTGVPDLYVGASVQRNPAVLNQYLGCAQKLPNGWYGREPLTTHCEGRSGRALVFRDSFAIALIPYLSASVGTVRYIWERPTAGRLEQEVEDLKPDVVIEERVERGIMPPPAAAEVARLRASMAGSAMEECSAGSGCESTE